MPIPLRGSAAVTTPQGMILLGGVFEQKKKKKGVRGNKWSNNFFKLHANNNGTMEWNTLPLKLKKGRSNHVVFLIPDKLSHCSNACILKSDDQNGTCNLNEVKESQLFILMVCLLIFGSITAMIFHMCKRNFLCFKSEELPTTIDSSNAMIPLQNFSYEENKNYDRSTNFEICKIPNSQLCMKNEIGKYPLLHNSLFLYVQAL